MHNSILNKAKAADPCYVGADPELFLQTKDGEFRSGHDSIPGTKRNPFMVNKGAVQVDGVACEFNIDPARNVYAFLNNMESVTTTLKLMVSKTSPDLKLVATPVAVFDKEYFSTLPSAARLLGCEPDYSAYTGKRNPRPTTKQPVRTGSGHIHVGWVESIEPTSKAHMAECIRMAKQMDAATFVPSQEFDSDTERRKLYGAPGAFRPKSYGFEYRTPSNAWVADKETQRWVFETTSWAYRLLRAGYHLYKHPKVASWMEESVGLSKEGKKTPTSLIEDYKKLLESKGFSSLKVT